MILVLRNDAALKSMCLSFAFKLPTDALSVAPLGLKIHFIATIFEFNGHKKSSNSQFTILVTNSEM